MSADPIEPGPPRKILPMPESPTERINRAWMEHLDRRDGRVSKERKEQADAFLGALGEQRMELRSIRTDLRLGLAVIALLALGILGRSVYAEWGGAKVEVAGAHGAREAHAAVAK